MSDTINTPAPAVAPTPAVVVAPVVQTPVVTTTAPVTPKPTKPTKPVSTKTPAKKATSKKAVSKKPVKLDQSKIRRGLKKAEAVAVVEKFKFPSKPFTMNEIFAATGIYHWYLVDFVKKNAKIVGDAPKAPGVRGKAAKLYQLTSAK